MARKFMKGTEAIAEAAVRSGCRFFAGYPITPQNEIPEYLARRLPEVGGAIVQGDREADDRIPLARQRYLINNLNLATELGGEVRRIRSNSPVESIAGVCREQKINIVCIGRPEFSLFSLLKSAIRLRRQTVRLSRMNFDLFIFS